MVLFYNLDFKSSFGYALKETFSTHPPVDFSAKHPIELLSEDGELRTYKIEDIVFHLPKNFSPNAMPSHYDEIFVRKIYESGACRIEPGEWVIDAGACEGFFSLYVLSKGANVIAFEPVPQLARALEKTLETHIKAGRAKVFQLALGDEIKEEKIMLDFVNAGASVLEDSDRTFPKPSSASVEIKIETLDHLYEKGLIEKVSFIKADVEGYERKLLKGAFKLIKAFQPKLALCHYHAEDDLEVLSKLIKDLELGYRLSLNDEVLFAWKK